VNAERGRGRKPPGLLPSGGEVPEARTPVLAPGDDLSRAEERDRPDRTVLTTDPIPEHVHPADPPLLRDGQAFRNPEVEAPAQPLRGLRGRHLPPHDDGHRRGPVADRVLGHEPEVPALPIPEAHGNREASVDDVVALRPREDLLARMLVLHGAADDDLLVRRDVLEPALDLEDRRRPIDRQRDRPRVEHLAGGRAHLEPGRGLPLLELPLDVEGSVVGRDAERLAAVEHHLERLTARVLDAALEKDALAHETGRLRRCHDQARRSRRRRGGSRVGPIRPAGQERPGSHADPDEDDRQDGQLDRTSETMPGPRGLRRRRFPRSLGGDPRLRRGARARSRDLHRARLASGGLRDDRGLDPGGGPFGGSP
jgi:hypothetical protein